MPRPARPTPGFAASCLLAIALAGCWAGRVAAFSTGEAIPLGIIDLEVGGWEVVPGSRPPLASLHPPRGDKAIAVFLRWSGGPEEMGTLDKRTLIETMLEHRLTLADRDGRHHSPVNAMPRDFYYGSTYTLDLPTDWVVVFHLDADDEVSSLRAEHPDPGVEGFRVAVVTLD